ncbi:MAG TPA: hypothetical protein DF699_09600 [Phycisphaerales bacterium]|nr:hypothetical protein [Phycisphaerae bacterium]HCT45455.1 hypothetical protein [Phycisphaerales bacterium]|tara:strand:+ start:138 stop:560 length:423 start_codon:yes stop_codon:yes gene_type:complete
MKRLLPIAMFGILLVFLPACALNPTYTVRIDNETNRTLRASLERRPTINEVISMDSARIKPGSFKVLGPSEARPLERVYIVIGDRTDLHAVPESVELRRGEWVVTIGAGSMTSWGTYELHVEKAKDRLIAEETEEDAEDE